MAEETATALAPELTPQGDGLPPEEIPVVSEQDAKNAIKEVHVA